MPHAVLKPAPIRRLLPLLSRCRPKDELRAHFGVLLVRQLAGPTVAAGVTVGSQQAAAALAATGESRLLLRMWVANLAHACLSRVWRKRGQAAAFSTANS